MKFVLIGAGQRGMIYARYAREKGHEIATVAEPDEVKRRIAGDELGIPAACRFETGRELLAGPKLGDAAIIATMDRDHFHEAIPAMEKVVLRERKMRNGVSMHVILPKLAAIRSMRSIWTHTEQEEHN